MSELSIEEARKRALDEIRRLEQAVSTSMAREIVDAQRRLTEKAVDAWEEERRDPWAESEEA